MVWNGFRPRRNLRNSNLDGREYLFNSIYNNGIPEDSRADPIEPDARYSILSEPDAESGLGVDLGEACRRYAVIFRARPGVPAENATGC